jgi:hypothetical protein
MSLTRLLLTIALISAPVFSLSADEPQIFYLACEYPAMHAVYGSTSDIVISGWSDRVGGVGVVSLRDRDQVTRQEAGFNIGADGNWSCRLQPTQHAAWSPGDYRLLINPVRQQMIAVPISIVPDPSGADIQPGLPLTTTGSKEYAKLPVVKFAEVALSSSIESAPQAPDVSKGANPGFTINSEFEFAVEGSFRIDELTDIGPSGIVLRFICLPVGTDAAVGQRTCLSEFLCSSQPTDDKQVFRFREVLRAPKQVGKLTLEAIYREKVICTAPVEVRQSAESPPGFDWDIEYPRANAIYEPTSEIVVAGRSKLFGEKVTVLVRDSGNVVSSVGQGTTGPSDGAWSCRLYYFTNHAGWPPGDCQIIVRPEHGAQKSFPIRILAAEDDTRIARQKGTKPGSDDFHDLSRLIMADVTISRPDVDQPEVIARGPSAGPTKIEADQEFAVQGSLNLKAAVEVTPSQVILRLRGNADRDRKLGETATLDEAIAEYEGSDRSQVFPYQAVMRAPSRPGMYSIDTIYRRAVIASATVVVVDIDPRSAQVECVYPEKDAVYTSTSDIAVTGRGSAFEMHCDVFLRDAGNMKKMSAICTTGPPEDDGKWSCALSMPRDGCRPGRYILDVVPKRGPRTSFPISIIADSNVADSNAPIPRRHPRRTSVDSAEYGDLPCFKFDAVTLPNPGRATPELAEARKAGGDGLTIEAGSEFAVECILRVPPREKSSPLDMVFRMTDSPRGDGEGQKQRKVILGESSARTEPKPDDNFVFRSRSVLRAPSRTGKFMLEAVYRNQIIATAEIKVCPRTSPVDAGWIIEYPPPGSAYAPASELVVAGKSTVFGTIAFVELLNSKQVVKSIAVVKTGSRQEDGIWSCRLHLPVGDDWQRGDYQIAIRPNSGGRLIIPITLMGAAEQSRTVPKGQIKIGTKEYDSLPQLEQAGVTLATSDSDNPKSMAREMGRKSPFVIDSQQEFSIQGILIFKDVGEFDPFNVIVRLRTLGDGDVQRSGNSEVTVGETIAAYHDVAEPERGYPFRAILHAPRPSGSYTVETIYRRAVIASSPIKVRASSEK